MCVCVSECVCEREKESVCLARLALDGTLLANCHLYRNSSDGPNPEGTSGCQVVLADVAHIRQSRPEYGLGLKVKVRKIFQVVASSLGSGYGVSRRSPSYGRACRWAMLGRVKT